MHEGWRRAMAGFGAVAIVAALSLLTISVLGALDDGGGRQTVGLGPVDPDATTTTTDRTTTTRRSTTTTTGDPEVLGETVQREQDGTTSTTAVPAPAPAPGPAPARPAPGPATTAPPATAPPTTVCRNSTDPACGDFRWDPQPAPAAVPVEVVSAPPSEAFVGEPVTFTLDYLERGGAAATGACGGWTVRGPRISDATTCEAVAHSCARHGPHDPPAPSGDWIRVTRTFTFEAPGTYRVLAEGFTATHLADGCANPYLASWSVPAYTVTVVER